MNNSAARAKAVLDALGWSQPTDLSIEEIAWACGLVVQYKEMSGSEGRIIMSDKEAIITVNDSITYQPKINYILSHEIGHAFLHRGILPLFNETHKTLSEWYTTGNHESEANYFAAELLMPSWLFSKKVTKKKLNLQLIEETASYFGASKTATFLRYRDLGDFPIMIVFIENGKVKWKSHSIDFPFKWLEYGSNVPPLSVAGDYFHHGVEESKPVKVDAIEWFPTDYKLLRSNETQKLFEQCFPTTRDSILTCLWTL